LERSTGLLVRHIDRKTPPGVTALRRFGSASGHTKAQAGMIANLLQPGASLAVSIREGGWLDDAACWTPSVDTSDQFLASIL